MFLYQTLIFSLLSLTFITVKTQDDDILSNLLDGGVNSMQNFKADLYLIENKVQALAPEKVDIKLYYECLCGDCRNFDTMSLSPTVEKLASSLNLHLYPYGNAQTIDKGNGVYEFKCQHGPAECYGNKLHACAIDHLANVTKAVIFNSCMMASSRKNRGSDDEAADEDKFLSSAQTVNMNSAYHSPPSAPPDAQRRNFSSCGRTMNVDTEKIKQCAKGDRGNTLLKHYGDESGKVGFEYVPYILINGVQNDGNNFLKDVCAAFKTPPAACAQVV